MSIAKASATEAWIRARDEYLKTADISLEEKKKLMSSRYEDVVSDLNDLEIKHAESSKVRRILAQLGPFFEGLEAVGQSLDVFVNADTHGVLSLVWGSLRVALTLAGKYRATLEAMIEFLEELPGPFGRLQICEKISPSSERVQASLCAVYYHFLGLTNSMRVLMKSTSEMSRMERLGSRFKKPKRWLDFNGEISNGITTMRKLCDEAFEEVDTAIKQDALHHQIGLWLSPVPVEELLEKNYRTISAGTCQWVEENSHISTWMNNSSSDGEMVWVNGLPGCGKSHIAAKVLKNLDARSPKAFFFCDYKTEAQRSAPSIVRTWVWQLLQALPGKFDAAAKSYRKRKSHEPTMTDLTHILHELVDGSHCRLVIDGLDECALESRGEILDVCRSLVTKCRMLVFSRDVVDIARFFASLPKAVSFHGVRVTGSQNQQDIELYLRQKIPSLELHNDDLERKVFKKLSEGASGMFLWVRLMIEHLGEKFSFDQMSAALDELPDGLDNTYSRILKDIAPAHRQNASLVLQWLVCSSRPLTLCELDTAFAIEPHRYIFNPSRRMRDPRKQLGIFASLLEIDSTTDTVRLVHASLKDFLLDHQSDSDASAAFRLNAHLAHRMIAESCLTYLSYDRSLPASALGNQSSDDCRQDLARFFHDHELLSYSCLNWAFHLAKSDIQSNRLAEDLERTLLFFIRSSSRSVAWLQAIHYAAGEVGASSALHSLREQMEANGAYLTFSQSDYVAWMSRIFGQPSNTESRYTEFLIDPTSGRFPPMHIAAFFNFADFVKSELQRGVQVDSLAAYEQSALVCAAKGDSVDVCKVLCAAGANVNATDHLGQTPLQVAITGVRQNVKVRSGPFLVVPILLDAGARLSIQDKTGRTALHLICERPNNDYAVNTLKLLLNYGSSNDITIKDKESMTALHLAVREGSLALAKTLLQHSVSPTDYDGCMKIAPTTTLLHSACSRPNNHLMVQWLIDAGADIDYPDMSFHRTPLHYAVDAGSQDAIHAQKLLSAGARIDGRDKDGRLPLHLAVLAQNLKIVQRLLEEGSNPLAVDVGGQTVLGLVPTTDGEGAKVTAIVLDYVMKNNLIQEAVLRHRLETLMRKGSSSIADLQQLAIDINASMSFSATMSDVLHVLFLLKVLLRAQDPGHIARMILESARYWVKSSVSCTIPARFTQASSGEVYLISGPIVGRPQQPVQQIVFTIESRDQGWSDYVAWHGTYQHSHTWFEAHLFASGHSEALAERPVIMRNVHASKRVHRHSIVWQADMPDSSHDSESRVIEKWMRRLEPGDKIAVIPRAMYPGWVNRVKSVQIDILTNCLKGSDQPPAMMSIGSSAIRQG